MINWFLIDFYFGDFFFKAHDVGSFDRALQAKKRRVTSATQLDLQQKDISVCFSGAQNKFPKHNLTLHGIDNKDHINEMNGFKIEEGSRRIFTSSSKQNSVDEMIKGLPGIVQLDMQDTLKSTLERRSSVQFVSESHIQPTFIDGIQSKRKPFHDFVQKSSEGNFLLYC